jgi:hypothetical protein
MNKIFNTVRLNKPIYVCDIETDNLLDEVTKIHCLSYGQMVDDKFIVNTLTDYEDIKKFVSRKDITIVGHNFISYDNLVFEKLLGIKFDLNQLIDSLYLSFYLYPKRLKHGLEAYGLENGQYKKEIKDWKNLTQQQYIERCEGDVRNNLLVWRDQYEYLSQIYNGDFEHIIDYLMFKADCIREQEQNPCRYDIAAANNFIDTLENIQTTKKTALENILPNVVKKATKTIKNVIKISDEEYYQKGDLMYEHYLRLNYPIIDHKITKITGETKPNSNSPKQIKDFLFSLGWVPTTFRKEKEDDGSIRKIEQIMSENGDGSLCASVKELFSIEPGLEHLESLGILKHRLGVVKGLNKDQKNGFIQGSASNLTKTLRLRHKGLVNLVKPSKAYGKELRGLIIAGENEVLIGADLSNIESRMKNHWIYPYDPEYVLEMSDPLFDSHLDTAVKGNLITIEESHFYKWYNSRDKDNFPVDKFNIEDYINMSEDLQKKLISEISVQRNKGKGTNFSAQYGAGPATIAEQNKIPLKVAKQLHKAYHDRNKSVKQFADSLTVKTVNGQKWIFNPLNNFWLFLSAEKDRFSAANQNSATFIMDLWLKYLREHNVIINYQCHDEWLKKCHVNDVDKVYELAKEAIDWINNTLKLNVTIDYDIKKGINYSDVH